MERSLGLDSNPLPGKDDRIMMEQLSQHFWSKNKIQPQNNLDLTFICRDGSVSGHSFLLKSASPMISQALLNTNVFQDDKIQIVVPDFTTYTVKNCLELIYTGRVVLNSNQDMEKVLHFVMKLLQIDLKLNTNATIEVVLPERSSHSKVYLSKYQPSPMEAPIVAEPIPFVEDVNANIKPMSVLFPKTKFIDHRSKTPEVVEMPEYLSSVAPTPNKPCGGISSATISSQNSSKPKVAKQLTSPTQAPDKDVKTTNKFKLAEQLPYNKEVGNPVTSSMVTNTAIITDLASPVKPIEKQKGINPSFQNVAKSSTDIVPVPPNEKIMPLIKPDQEVYSSSQKTHSLDSSESQASANTEQLKGVFASTFSEVDNQQTPMDIDSDNSEPEKTAIQLAPKDVITTENVPSHQHNKSCFTAEHPVKSNKSNFTITKATCPNVIIKTSENSREEVVFIGGHKTTKTSTEDQSSSYQNQNFILSTQNSVSQDQTSSIQDPNYTELVKSAILDLAERKGSTIKSITKHIIDNKKFQANKQVTMQRVKYGLRLALKNEELVRSKDGKSLTYKIQDKIVSKLKLKTFKAKKIRSSFSRVGKVQKNLKSKLSSERATKQEQIKLLNSEEQQPNFKDTFEAIKVANNAEKLLPESTSLTNSSENTVFPFSKIEEVTKCVISRYKSEQGSSEKFEMLCKNREIYDLVFDLSEILEGLGILQLARIDTGYKWSGIDRAKIRDAILGILDGKNKLDNSTSWKGFCKVVPLVVQGRRGGRVYINQIENEQLDRSLKLSLAVLKVLEMVEIPGPSIYSGIIWTRESDIFEVWDSFQVKVNSTPILQLKQAKVTLSKTTVSEVLLKLALERAEQNPVFLPLPTKKTRWNIVCTCGQKKMKTLTNRGPNTSYKRKIILFGNKRKTRCKTCIRCLAKNCQKCKFCLNPQWKKPCVTRICRTPNNPRCPCFQ